MPRGLGLLVDRLDCWQAVTEDGHLQGRQATQHSDQDTNGCEFCCWRRRGSDAKVTFTARVEHKRGVANPNHELIGGANWGTQNHYAKRGQDTVDGPLGCQGSRPACREASMTLSGALRHERHACT